jgi:hypothetical protein
MIFETSDLEKSKSEMALKGVKFLESKKGKNGQPAIAIFLDPFGNISEIVGKSVN